jgi:hypothetical protein
VNKRGRDLRECKNRCVNNILLVKSKESPTIGGQKNRNLNDLALENHTLVSEKEWVSHQTHLGLDTSRPLVFDSNLKSYVATHLISAICAESQASYV